MCYLSISWNWLLCIKNWRQWQVFGVTFFESPLFFGNFIYNIARYSLIFFRNCFLTWSFRSTKSCGFVENINPWLSGQACQYLVFKPFIDWNDSSYFSLCHPMLCEANSLFLVMYRTIYNFTFNNQYRYNIYCNSIFLYPYICSVTEIRYSNCSICYIP